MKNSFQFNVGKEMVKTSTVFSTRPTLTVQTNLIQKEKKSDLKTTDNNN